MDCKNIVKRNFLDEIGESHLHFTNKDIDRAVKYSQNAKRPLFYSLNGPDKKTILVKGNEEQVFFILRALNQTKIHELGTWTATEMSRSKTDPSIWERMENGGLDHDFIEEWDHIIETFRQDWRTRLLTSITSFEDHLNDILVHNAKIEKQEESSDSNLIDIPKPDPELGGKEITESGRSDEWQINFKKLIHSWQKYILNENRLPGFDLIEGCFLHDVRYYNGCLANAVNIAINGLEKEEDMCKAMQHFCEVKNIS